ncbi:hypothetical protein BVY12_29335, partial [Pseudomonas amygdali pv. morsprunorum]
NPGRFNWSFRQDCDGNETTRQYLMMRAFGFAVVGCEEFCLLLMRQKHQSELTHFSQMPIVLLGAPMPEVSV